MRELRNSVVAQKIYQIHYLVSVLISIVESVIAMLSLSKWVVHPATNLPPFTSLSEFLINFGFLNFKIN